MLMGIPMNPLLWAAAAVPILFLLAVIMKFGWGVAKAAPIGMVLAGFIAVICYRSSLTSLLYETQKGAWNAATILLVIWPAVFSYELTCESRGFQSIRQGIQSLTQHELQQILILGWVFPSFLQGITGFGVAVAVGAPLLLSIGVAPFYSIVIVLLCHCWGATFGTLALAWEALVAQSGISGIQLSEAAVIAAVMIWCFNLVCVLYSCWLYGRWKGLKEAAPLVFILSMIMGGGQLVLAPVNGTISCFLPSAVALGAVFLFSRTKRYQQSWAIKDSKIMERRGTDQMVQHVMSFHQAFLPYYALTVITVICLLVPPVNRVLELWKIGYSFPETVTGYGFITQAEVFFSPLKPLTYAGTFLLASSVISFFYYKRKGYIKSRDLAAVWHRTAHKCKSPTIAILCFIILSKFMGSSGQIYVLSQGIVGILGRFYVIAAPFFGMMGAFITSSNMSSNILLGNFQMTAAGILAVNPAVTVALQTVGGVLGTAFTPGCVIMGISTTGFSGSEGEILKTIIPVSAGCGLLFGVAAYLFLV